MIRPVRRADLANTVLYRFAVPRDLKPRRPSIRRKASIRAPHLGRPIYVRPQPIAPRWFRSWDHVAAAVALIAVLLVAIYATGNKIEVFRP